MGSNLGDRLTFLKAAVNKLAEIGLIENKSAIYETEPYGFKDQPNYLNAVCTFKFVDKAPILLRYLKNIEKHLGRKETIHWGPRFIDLDIIDWDGEVLETSDLIIPHPEMHKRNFVLIPLAEIEPDYKNRDGLNIKQMLDRCSKGFIERYREQW